MYKQSQLVLNGYNGGWYYFNEVYMYDSRSMLSIQLSDSARFYFGDPIYAYNGSTIDVAIDGTSYFRYNDIKLYDSATCGIDVKGFGNAYFNKFETFHTTPTGSMHTSPNTINIKVSETTTFYANAIRGYDGYDEVYVNVTGSGSSFLFNNITLGKENNVVSFVGVDSWYYYGNSVYEPRHHKLVQNCPFYPLACLFLK